MGSDVPMLPPGFANGGATLDGADAGDDAGGDEGGGEGGGLETGEEAIDAAADVGPAGDPLGSPGELSVQNQRSEWRQKATSQGQAQNSVRPMRASLPLFTQPALTTFTPSPGF